MPLSIGVNLRVTGHCNQGGRKYMEDMFSVAYQQSSNDRELEYAFFGIFDGHGGGEAATFAKENLMDIIVKQKNFWSDNDEDVLKAIRDGYVNTHYAMWRELDKWPRTASGLPSTAGTTASIAFIRKGKIYIGHVGDSGIILGYQDKDDPVWQSTALTKDHKPECGVEMTRIQESGGKVISKSGVPRVVWNRPRLGHKGPVRRSTHIDEIPFLAIARSLGDLWSYNSELNTFVVSPEPDVKVVKIDVKSHRCLIFGTDGLWNMLTPQAAVAIVQAAEKHNEKHLIASQQTGNGQGGVQVWINPSKSLVDRALDKWSLTRLRADNTSVVTLMLDPPGPTHSEILLSQKRDQMAATQNIREPVSPEISDDIPSPNVHNIYPHVIQKPCNSFNEPVVYSDPTASVSSTPPSFSEIQKQPDSSNNFVDDITNIANEGSSSNCNSTPFSTTSNSSSCISDNKCPSFPSKEEMWSNQSFVDSPLEESIQVAEISSSNVSDERSTSPEKDNTTAVCETGAMMVESSLCMEETLPNEDMLMAEATEFMLERESWLQRVPEAEQYPANMDNAAVQSIRFVEPQEPRLRRSVTHESNKRINNGSPSTSYSSNVSLRQTTNSSRRRHSTGGPPNSQRQPQRQRRSLTPKSSMGGPSAYLSGTNRLKRGAKAMLQDNSFEEPRIGGVVSRHGGECRYESKNRDGGEPCLKRRTRSEDIRNLHRDENSPSNQKIEQHHDRLRWPVNDTMISRTNGVLNASTGGIHERRLSSPNSFKRRNLEKKVTPVKTIRRPSINRSTGRHPIRDSFWSDQGRASRTGTSCAGNRRQTVVSIINSMSDSMAPSTSASSTPSSSAPKRWLRSDTIAATPIKTLRSRNVDLAGGHTLANQMIHQYGPIKANRMLESTPKFKPQVSPNGNILSPSNSQTPVVTKPKSTVCTTPSPTAPTNRIKQSCNMTPVVNSNSAACISTSSTSSGSISKRAKTPYNPSARSLSTRSRIKRFSK